MPYVEHCKSVLLVVFSKKLPSKGCFNFAIYCDSALIIKITRTIVLQTLYIAIININTFMWLNVI